VQFPYKNGYILAKEQPKVALLDRTDENGVTVAERLIEFCRTPKSKAEVNRFLGMAKGTTQWVWDKYLQPLIDDGRLKMTLPKNKTSQNLRFVSGEVAVPTEVAILEFCAEQRTRREIIEHFGLTEWTTWTYINPLVESGKLNLTSPNSGVMNKAQRYTSQPVVVKKMTDEALREYCKEPRSRNDILKHFDIIEDLRGRRVIAQKVREGVIEITNPHETDRRKHKMIAKID
jgi:hypothetical protein